MDEHLKIKIDDFVVILLNAVYTEKIKKTVNFIKYEKISIHLMKYVTSLYTDLNNKNHSLSKDTSPNIISGIIKHEQNKILKCLHFFPNKWNQGVM